MLLPELFTATEVDRLRDVAEQVHAEVVSAAEAGETTVNIWPDGHRLETVRGTTIHWEPSGPSSRGTRTSRTGTAAVARRRTTSRPRS